MIAAVTVTLDTFVFKRDCSRFLISQLSRGQNEDDGRNINLKVIATLCTRIRNRQLK